MIEKLVYREGTSTEFHLQLKDDGSAVIFAPDGDESIVHESIALDSHQVGWLLAQFMLRRAELPALTWRELDYLARATEEHAMSDGDQTPADPMGNSLLTAIRETQYSIERMTAHVLDDR